MEPNQDFIARCIEAYGQHDIPFIANLLDVAPAEVSRTLRKSGILTEIQSFELTFIVENINAMPDRAIAEHLGLSTTQLDQALRRYDIRKDFKKEHMTREICIAQTRWLIEKRLEFPVNDELPRSITNAHFTEHGLYPVVAFATANKAECPIARHFSACAFLVCEAYPDRFKPWQFRHAKQNAFFCGEEGRKSFLDALLWLTETKMNITRQALPYAMKSHNFLNVRTLQEYGLGVHWWREHWRNKSEMLAAFAEEAGVTPAEHRGRNTARVRARLHAAGTHPIVRQATRPTSDLKRSRRTPAPSPPASPNPVKTLENEVKTIMAEEFDQKIGSQTNAKRFRKKYPDHQITLKRLAELFTEVRGRTLPRGRPKISRKISDNNPQQT